MLPWEIAKKELPPPDFTGIWIEKDRVSYWSNGKLHRENGPAIIDKSGTAWYYNGKAHRYNGPAAEFGGTKLYILNDIICEDEKKTINSGYPTITNKYVIQKVASSDKLPNAQAGTETYNIIVNQDQVTGLAIRHGDGSVEWFQDSLTDEKKKMSERLTSEQHNKLQKFLDAKYKDGTTAREHLDKHIKKEIDSYKPYWADTVRVGDVNAFHDPGWYVYFTKWGEVDQLIRYDEQGSCHNTTGPAQFTNSYYQFKYKNVTVDEKYTKDGALHFEGGKISGWRLDIYALNGKVYKTEGEYKEALNNEKTNVKGISKVANNEKNGPSGIEQFKDMIIEDAQDGAVRAGVSELVETVRDTLVKGLTKELGFGTNEVIQHLVGKFLQTSVGEACLGMTLAASVPLMKHVIPGPYHKYLEGISSELRKRSMERFIRPAIKLFKEPVLKYIKSSLGMEDQQQIRVVTEQSTFTSAESDTLDQSLNAMKEKLNKA